jgi:hypothetical protein
LFSISIWLGSLWIFATPTLPSQRAAFADVVRMIAPANAPPWLPDRLESWAQGLRHDQRFDGPTKGRYQVEQSALGKRVTVALG